MNTVAQVYKEFKHHLEIHWLFERKILNFHNVSSLIDVWMYIIHIEDDQSSSFLPTFIIETMAASVEKFIAFWPFA